MNPNFYHRVWRRGRSIIILFPLKTSISIFRVLTLWFKTIASLYLLLTLIPSKPLYFLNKSLLNSATVNGIKLKATIMSQSKYDKVTVLKTVLKNGKYITPMSSNNDNIVLATIYLFLKKPILNTENLSERAVYALKSSPNIIVANAYVLAA